MLNYGDLESRIIETGICTSCGACIAACPNYFIKFIDGKVKGTPGKADCANCDKCYNACYMVRRELMGELGKIIFGRRKKENIGIYERILSARTKGENIKEVCQDGGIVTSLLIHSLEENFIDGALVTGKEEWMPITSVAKARDEFFHSAGTKYGVVPILEKLRAAAMDQGLSRLCVVGSPCHVQSVRYLQHSNMPLASVAKFTIGLFCRENYMYHCIEEKVTGNGLKVEEIEKFEISEEFNIYVNGEKISFPITEAKNWIPKHCLVCEDFTSELADISIGSDGSPEGWSTVITRTDKGERIFSNLERSGLIDVKPIENFDKVKELADRKRGKGKQTRDIFRLKEKGLEKYEIAAKLGITEERVSHRLKRL